MKNGEYFGQTKVVIKRVFLLRFKGETYFMKRCKLKYTWFHSKIPRLWKMHYSWVLFDVCLAEEDFRPYDGFIRNQFLLSAIK